MSKPERTETNKRLAVYAKPRTTVLIKLFATKKIEGIPVIKRDEQAIVAKQKAEAEKRGLDFQAYRDRGDTGHCWTEKKENVTVVGLLRQLETLGLNFVGGHCHIQPGKGPVTTLTFSTEGEPQVLPVDIRRLLQEEEFNHCTVWCNLKFRDPENPEAGQFRLDTINLAKPKPTFDGWTLRIKGNTYVLT